MDKRKSYLNVTTAITFKILILVLSLITRKLLINYTGIAIGGLNALFLSIVGVLSIAEIGIGSAITYSMYGPIVRNEDNEVSALYYLFKRLYFKIGIFILILGLLVIPFLDIFAKDYEIDFYIIVCYIVMLVSTVLGYFFFAKISLINAYKNNYISTIISSVATIILLLLQIIVLFLSASFLLYLLMRIISVFIQYFMSKYYCDKYHREIINNKAVLSLDTKIEVRKNIKAMLMHKLGGVMVIATDSLIISAYVGVNALGKYDNYSLIVTSMVSVIILFFTPLTTIIGHLYIKDRFSLSKYFKAFYLFNLVIGLLFFYGYYATINQIITLWVGDDLLLDNTLVKIITINAFINFLRQTVLLFRDATGTFYNDRYKPLIEGILNIILSIIFVRIFGIKGVVLSTIITNLIITHLAEPYVLFKYGFKKQLYSYYLINYLIIMFFVFLLYLFDFIKVFTIKNTLTDLVLSGIISSGIIGIISLILYFTNPKIKKIFRVYFNKNYN